MPTGAPTTTSGPTATGVVYSTPAPVPTNAMAGSNHRCGKWYTVRNQPVLQALSVGLSSNRSINSFLDKI